MNLEKIQLSKIINQDPRELLKLYKTINPVLQSFFLKKIQNPQDRQEIIQDTLLSILDSLPAFNYNSSLKTYIYSIARHELVDYYRKKKIKNLLFSHFPFLENLIDKALGPQLALEEKEKKQQIYQTFKKLNEGYSLILRLRYIEGLSVNQISKKLNLSYKAAESRLSRARLAFQKSFV